ncbi:MAG TPA: class I SAM-dependent methyltransferase [Geminicoccaceae bacterium]|mgnify:CR=1 FL=1|nr:class I SAM-dependent methyltransferase [Geminicoccus sp.]HMU52781.1 class I SAM-dependent methyltransferase [Geminicoccaceae bacterium]
MSHPRARVLAMALHTLLGRRRQGFFIPYRYAASVEPAGYPGLEPLFAAAEPRMRELVDVLAGFRRQLALFGGAPPTPRFDQDWFPRLDGAAAYALVRRLRPHRIVEIGSGHSTRFMARAIADGGLDCEITCIDPSPRAKLAGLPVRHLPMVLAEAGPQALAGLAAGDVLFVDSSHVAMPGTDVDRLLGDVLPGLPAGIVLHVHDIFLPDAYPADWSWRGYGEQLPVACLLQGGGYDILFASHWVATRRPAWLDEAGLSGLPLAEGARESSLWLVKIR